MSNYFLYYWGQKITRALPLNLAYRLACVMADVQCFLSYQDRRNVEHNLHSALGRPPLYQETREVFRNFARYLVDFFTMTGRVNEHFVKEHVQIKGMEQLNDILSHGKGGIIITAHLGNWEMGGAILPLMGFPISVVALPHQDVRVNNFFNNQREQFGCMVISTNVAIRKVITQLKQNKLVAILAERDFGPNGLRMPFLDKTALIPKGAAMFALKTQAPVVPAFFLRDGHDAFKVVFGETIFPPALKDEKISDDDLKAFINTYLGTIERFIRQYPTQWLMFRDFTQS